MSAHQGIWGGDTITIAGLNLHARHGCFEAEQVLGQNFILDILLRVDLAAAGASDALEDTVDYGAVTHSITRHFTQEPFRLIEAAAHHVAMALLEEFPPVLAVRLTVRKPNAPVKAHFEHMACTVERIRHEC
jgi:7,8-dihydroneopterin aldolase/epimerase/oxygenase